MSETHTVEIQVSPEVFHDEDALNDLRDAAKSFAAVSLGARGLKLGRIKGRVDNAVVGVYDDKGVRQGWRIPFTEDDEPEQYLVAWTWTIKGS